MKKKLIYIITLLTALSFVIIGYNVTKVESSYESKENFEIGTVISVGEIYEDESSELIDSYIPFEVKVNGNILSANQALDNISSFRHKNVEIGDSVLVLQVMDGTWQFVNYNKIPWLIVMCLIFLGLIILIGKKKGINTIISLIFTISVIFLIYIPGVLKGYNIYILTSVIISFIVIISLILLNGLNKKTICAILGNLSGIILVGFITIIFNNLLKITGLVDSDYIYLSLLDSDNPIDLKALVWGGILIGSIGAIMDISMTISSSLNELSIHMKEKSFRKLLTSGLEIGKDAIGTMTNTLILAYIGGSLGTVLLLNAYTKNPLELFNLEMIVVEISQSIIGSIGILISVPATALIGSYLYTKKHQK